jgi:hypothetical protein
MLKMLMAIQDAGTAKEAIEYAAREAASPELGHYVGGSALGLLLTILIICAIVALIFWLLRNHY